MTHSPAALAAAFRRQAKFCADLGSPLWSQAMEQAARNVESGGVFGDFLADWQGDLERGILPLRLFGGLHYVALAGRAPALAAQLPSTGGKPDLALWPSLVAALGANFSTLRRFLDRPPQTNEIARSAIFLGGFLEVAAQSRLPLALLEVGASAGLNLCWDRFAYRLGPHRWQGRDPALDIETEWRGPAPWLDTEIKVVSRLACDRQPLDIADPEARLALQGYVWPDQVERLALLRKAIALALEMGIHVDAADALDWAGTKIEERASGQATVVYHSVVLQYFDKPAQKRFAAMLKAAGAEASAERPLAWLAYEQPGPDEEFELSLTYWPGGERRRLAMAHPHGKWIEWCGW